jgi:hypothetical protein
MHLQLKLLNYGCRIDPFVKYEKSTGQKIDG